MCHVIYAGVTDSLKEDFSLHEYHVKTETDKKVLLVSCFLHCILSIMENNPVEGATILKSRYNYYIWGSTGYD